MSLYPFTAPRANPHAVGAECQRGGEPTTVVQAPGGDDRNLLADGVDHLRHECHRGDGAGMAPCFGALGDDEVASTCNRGYGVLHLAAHRTDEHVVLVQEIDHLAGHAETGDEDRRTTIDDGLDALVHLVG